MNGLQGGDPAKLATALVQLIGSVEPPLRWAAGADAVGVLGQKAVNQTGLQHRLHGDPSRRSSIAELWAMPTSQA